MNFDLSSLQALAQKEIDENQSNGNDNNSGIPIYYPVFNGTIRFKPLFNPKSNILQRKLIRHNGSSPKVPCFSMYGQECEICSAIREMENIYGKECGAWGKYGSKTRGIMYAVLTYADPSILGNNDFGIKVGDLFILMYPPSLYNEFNDIVVKSGAFIQSLVASNVGKTIELERSQKNGGFPDYKVGVYAYGDETVFKKEDGSPDNEKFDKIFDEIPSLNETITPAVVDDSISEKARALAETIKTEYNSGKVLNPNDQTDQIPQDTNNSGEVQNLGQQSNPVQNNQQQSQEFMNPPIENQQVQQSAPPVQNNVPTQQNNLEPQAQSQGGVPECFGQHSDSEQKCLLCPNELDCMQKK